MTDLNSRPYNPDAQKCCEACVFGRGAHASFCASAEQREPLGFGWDLWAPLSDHPSEVPGVLE